MEKGVYNRVSVVLESVCVGKYIQLCVCVCMHWYTHTVRTCVLCVYTV